MSITIVDSIMGAGKTSWAIDYMNKDIDFNVLYIAPYLDQTKRIREGVKNRNMILPSFRTNTTKLEDISNLLAMQNDVASTHALFLKLDADCKEAIKQGHYTLFLDETIAAVEPYNLTHKDDIDYLLNRGSIEINRDGFIEWKDDDMDTRYNPIRILAQNHSLFYVNQKLLMWRYPPDIFSLFDNIYIMTYMFDASILKYYFDLNHIEYDIKSISKEGDTYKLCDYYKPDTSRFKSLIHIYDKDDLNDSFAQKITALSSTWFKNQKANKQKIKILKDNIYNYFQHKEPAKSDEIMWTTFLDAKSKLTGKGYTKGFISCNCRATDEYKSRNHLCYCLNVYPHVGITQFFAQHGIEINQDRYALSEMLQWIWRSSVRMGNEIWIYIPSKRMRKLLKDWLAGVN